MSVSISLLILDVVHDDRWHIWQWCHKIPLPNNVVAVLVYLRVLHNIHIKLMRHFFKNISPFLMDIWLYEYWKWKQFFKELKSCNYRVSRGKYLKITSKPHAEFMDFLIPLRANVWYSEVYHCQQTPQPAKIVKMVSKTFTMQSVDSGLIISDSHQKNVTGCLQEWSLWVPKLFLQYHPILHSN